MAKIKRRVCKSLKEFNKILRKYIRYFGLRWDNYQRFWYVWLSYYVLNEELFGDEITKYADKCFEKGDKNLKHILKEARDNYGYKFEHRNGNIYTFTGIEITNEDYYYVFASAKDMISSTCVGSWKDVPHYYGEK